MDEQNAIKMTEKLGLTLSHLNSPDCLRLISELLSLLTTGDLLRVRNLAEQMRQARLSADKASIIEAMELKLKEMGIDLDEVELNIGKKKRKGTGRTIPPKYRGLEGQLWTGRGSVPKWIRDHEAAGGDREEFLVDDGGK
jgi:DNA-binding protein H-NS